MTHLHRRLFLKGGLALGMSGVVGMSVGCFKEGTNRAQLPDDPEKDLYATIGAKTSVGNAEPIPISNVGLVYNLKGTGSVPAPDGWRTSLESQLKKMKLSPKEILEDPEKSTSLVMVSALIPPGSRSGDKLDAEITIPPGSKTTSLKHGVLMSSTLSNYELAGQARKNLTDSGLPVGKVPAASSDALIMGNKLATAEGPLVTGSLVSADKPAKSDDGEQKTERGPIVAKIWDGAICHYDRPYYFILNENTPQPKLAVRIAARLNAVFHGTGERAGKVAEAKVQGKPLVAIFVPPSYRLNHMRFLMVARQITLIPLEPRDPQRKRLEAELLQPETAITASLKLEAMGVESEDVLRIGLEEESPWVRFAAASSLCYLGKADPRVAQILGDLATKHMSLRSHCLTALASQDDAPCTEQLVELMKKGDPTLRYGAFTALRCADENNDAIRGRRMGHSFWIHMIGSESEPLVHLTSERRNELVLFGKNWPIKGTFSIPLGSEFTVSLKAGENEVSINRVVNKKYATAEEDSLQVVNAKVLPDLSLVIKGIVELGGTYGDTVELIRRLSAMECLESKVAIDALPRGMNVQSLAQIARTDPTLSKADKEVTRVTSGGLEDSYEIPNDADAVRKPQADTGPALNRNPGRLTLPGKTKND